MHLRLVVSVVVVALLALAGPRAHARGSEFGEAVHADRTLDAWVADLAAPDVERRRGAAFACWALRRDLVPHAAAVARACADDDPYVRSTASKALESLGFRGAAAFPVLVRAYADAAPDRREALAAACLAAMPRAVGAAEVALVLPWLGDADPARRAFARTVLSAAGGTAGPAAATALAAALAAACDAGPEDGPEVVALRGTLAAVDPVGSLASDEREQRLAALRVLDAGAADPPPAVVAAVVALLTDPEDDVRAGAVVVTSTILMGRDPAVRAIASPAVVAAWKGSPRGEARRYLPLCLARAAKDHAPALDALREALASSEDGVVAESLLAVRELDPLPDDLLARAVRELRGRSSERRTAATYVLRRAGGAAAEACVAPLVVACFDADPAMRRAAGEALGACGAPDATVAAVVRAALAAHRDHATESGGLEALAAVGTGAPEDVAVARERAADGLHPATRLLALELVLRWDWASAEHERAVLAAACLADDPSERAQAWAVVRALAAAKVPLGPWAATLAPSDAPLRIGLRCALVRCLAGDPRPSVVASDVVRVGHRLGMLSELSNLSTADEMEAESVLEPLLASREPAVRAAAAFAFRHLGFSAELAADALARMAASDPDLSIRPTAAATVALLRRRGMTVPDVAGPTK
ncbi:MAG: hypothetical protein JNM10_03840 [Planctomycetia bacterium]|nr:hypothetical protein [Planctomycetia bacterium]